MVPVAVHYTEQAAAAAAHGVFTLVDVVEHGVVMSLAAEVPLLLVGLEEMVTVGHMVAAMGAAVLRMTT